MRLSSVLRYTGMLEMGSPKPESSHFLREQLGYRGLRPLCLISVCPFLSGLQHSKDISPAPHCLCAW